MKTEITIQDRARWRELIQSNGTIGLMFQYALENTPVAFDPKGNVNPEVIALRSVYADGWRKSLEFLMSECTEINDSSQPTLFQDMSDTSEIPTS